jgi:hypothetical protein
VSMDIPTPETGALKMSPINEVAIYSKVALMTLIRFQQCIESMCLHNTALLVSSEMYTHKCEMWILSKLGLPVDAFHF